MGTMDAVDDETCRAHTPSSDAMRKRNVHGQQLDCTEADYGSDIKKDVTLTDDEELEATIRALPSWKDQLSLRGYIVGEKATKPDTVAEAHVKQ